MFNWILALVNFTEFYDNPIEWALTPFRVHLGDYLWPSIFAAAIAFVYVTTHSIGSVLATILLVFGLFGSTSDFIVFPEFRLFFSILAVAGLAGVILSLFLKKHGG